MNSLALLHDKLLRLQGELDAAFMPQLTGEDRHRYVQALTAIANFLDGISPIDRHSIKLIELASALSDLDQGTIAPFLRAQHIENRAPDSTQKWIGQAHVAISLEALVLTGQTRPSAANHIETDYPSIFSLATRKAKNLRTVILGWHREFEHGRVKNDLAKRLFDVGHWHLKEYAALPEYSAVFFADIAKKNLLEAAQIAAGVPKSLHV